MNLIDGLQKAFEMCPDVDESEQTKELNKLYPDPQEWADAYSSYRAQPQLYPNIATMLCSPYIEDNWGDVNGIVASFSEDVQTSFREDYKIDPNKIFTQDIAALRSLAADQIRVKKLFEKRLTESLKDKDKYGLNENDIMAMQALTAANNAVTAINKEQINIRKNIADIRLKQQQNQMRNTNNSNVNGASMSNESYDSSSIGRQIMDDLFKQAGTRVDLDTVIPYTDSVEGSIDQASQVLDELIPSNPTSTRYETLNPTTYVLVDEAGNNLGYETMDENGNVIEDYNNPTALIREIDQSAETAIDELDRVYPIKRVNNNE